MWGVYSTPPVLPVGCILERVGQRLHSYEFPRPPTGSCFKLRYQHDFQVGAASQGRTNNARLSHTNGPRSKTHDICNIHVERDTAYSIQQGRPTLSETISSFSSFHSSSLQRRSEGHQLSSRSIEFPLRSHAPFHLINNSAMTVRYNTLTGLVSK